MTKENQSYLNMSVTVESYLLQNLGICSNLPEFTPYYTNVQDCNKQINDVLVMIESSNHPDTATKKLLREKLTEECMDVIRKMKAYAVNKNLQELLAGIAYSKSELNKSFDRNLITICDFVVEQANNHQVNLNNYSITPADITSLQQTTGDFKTILPKSRMNYTEIKKSRLELKNLFTRLRQSWNNIDYLMEILRKDQAGFYFEYQQLRKLTQIKRSSVDLSIKIYEKQSGEALSMVKLSLSPLAGPEQESFEANAARIEKKTKMYGCFFRNLSEGNYTITASKAGYADTIKTVTIVKGEYTAVNIVMEKL